MESTSNVLPKIVLHAGRHKTGTTSIQGFLGINEDVLANKYQILYSSIGRNKKKFYHHSIFKSLVTDGSPLDRDQIQSIINEASERKCHTVLLSSEMLSRPNLSNEQLLAVKDAFLGHEVKIILYLRKQDDFYISNYAEHVKRGLLKSPKNIMDISQDSLDYFSFVERYSSVFGKESVIVKSFDKCKGQNLYKNFLDTLGSSVNERDFVIPKSTLNIRYSWRHIEMIRLMGRFGLSVFFAKNKLVLFLASMLNKKFPEFMASPKPMTEEEAFDLYNKYKESNERLEREYLNGEKLF